jgi:hypothetical protein
MRSWTMSSPEPNTQNWSFTMKPTDVQSLRMAELPENYRVLGVDRSAPFVRKPTGQVLPKPTGRLTAATTEAKCRLADRRADQTESLVSGLLATTPHRVASSAEIGSRPLRRARRLNVRSR